MRLYRQEHHVLYRLYASEINEHRRIHFLSLLPEERNLLKQRGTLTWKDRSVAISSMASFVRRHSTSCFESFEGQARSSASFLAVFLAEPGVATDQRQSLVPLCEIARWKSPVSYKCYIYVIYIYMLYICFAYVSILPFTNKWIYVIFIVNRERDVERTIGLLYSV